MKRWMRNTLIALVILIVAGLAGVRVSHPKGGLSDALGPAHSGLAIYLKGNTAKVGDKVVYVSQDTKHSPSLGDISGVNPKYVDVQNGKFVEGVSYSMIQGHLVIVITFIGWLL